MFLLDIELSKDASEPDGLDFGRLVRKMSDYKHTPVLFLQDRQIRFLWHYRRFTVVHIL